MSDKKTPLEIAREVWPLEWEQSGTQQISAPVFGHWVTVMSDDDGAEIECSTGDSWEGTDLRAVLTEARDQTTRRLHEALALCAPAYPVPVVRHPGTGEAVLMLTSAMDGSPAPIPARHLPHKHLYYIENSDGSVSLRVQPPGLLSVMWSVRESTEDIRATLAMLDAEKSNG